MPLKGKWYDMYEAGIKKEEYREITEYWKKRLFKGYLGEYCWVENTDGEFKEFTHVRFRYGYTKRTMLFKLNDIDIGKGNPDWGAPDHEVFIIKLGDRVE